MICSYFYGIGVPVSATFFGDQIAKTFRKMVALHSRYSAMPLNKVLGFATGRRAAKQTGTYLLRVAQLRWGHLFPRKDSYWSENLPLLCFNRSIRTERERETDVPERISCIRKQ